MVIALSNLLMAAVIFSERLRPLSITAVFSGFLGIVLIFCAPSSLAGPPSQHWAPAVVGSIKKSESLAPT